MALAALPLPIATASAATIIAPVSATIEVGGVGSGLIENTFNQAGLLSGYTSGVTDFDSYIATNPTHNLLFEGAEWFGDLGTTTAQVTYSLGSVMSIDRLALWNEETAGIGTLELSSSLDGITFTSLGVFTPFDNPLANYPAEVISFAPTNARFVRFGMSGCPQTDPGSYESCALGEVAFRLTGAIPEPATWAMMMLGFIGAGSILRASRRKTRAVPSCT
jgi:hypothetical protein